MDVKLFHWINGAGFPGWIDALVAHAADARFVLPWIALAALASVLRAGKRWRSTLLAAAVAAGACDRLNHALVKGAFGRARPCAELGAVELREPRCPASFSFPSSHVSNSAAALGVVALSYPLTTPAAVGLVGIVGLGRVRGGVHYPGDVVGGALLGLGVAALTVRVARLRWSARITSIRSALRSPLPYALAVVFAASVLAQCSSDERHDARPASESIAALASADVRARVDAARSLRRRCRSLPPASGSPLIGALADVEPQVRFNAAKAIGCLEPIPDAAEPLGRTLADPVVGVRESAAWSLARMGTRGLGAVRAALEHPDANVRLAAAHALRMMDRGVAADASVWRRLVADRDPRVSREAAAVLASDPRGR